VDVIAECQCLKPQLEFIHTKATRPAIIGGYGSGKSAGGVRRAFHLKMKYPRNKIAIYSPTYSLLRDYWFEALSEYADFYRIPHTLNKSDHEFHIQGYGKMLLRSMDKPESIVTYEVADSLVDEIDILPIDKAELAWKKIIGRNRERKADGAKNTVGAMTTPEGFRFAYDRWKKNPKAGYVMFRARTADNPFLPDTFLDDLKEDYDPILLQAYAEGFFVNLTQGSVYYGFDPEQDMAQEELQFDPTLPIRLCVDFNVDPMIWEIIQHRSRYDIRVVKEIHKRNTNTWKMCDEVKELIPDSHDLHVYGDAAGESRDTRGNETDYIIIDKMLRAYFKSITYHIPKANPPVKTRVKSMNSRLSKRAMRMSPSCKELKEDLIQVCWKDNDIEKKDKKRTHASDSVGYYTTVEFPILIERPIVVVRQR